MVFSLLLNINILLTQLKKYFTLCTKKYNRDLEEVNMTFLHLCLQQS